MVQAGAGAPGRWWGAAAAWSRCRAAPASGSAPPPGTSPPPSAAPAPAQRRGEGACLGHGHGHEHPAPLITLTPKHKGEHVRVCFFNSANNTKTDEARRSQQGTRAGRSADFAAERPAPALPKRPLAAARRCSGATKRSLIKQVVFEGKPFSPGFRIISALADEMVVHLKNQHTSFGRALSFATGRQWWQPGRLRAPSQHRGRYSRRRGG